MSRIRQLFAGLIVWRCGFNVRIFNVGLVVGGVATGGSYF
jgi:hypothetical protein